MATIAPGLLDPADAAPWRGRLPALDEVESGSLAFLLAFDLDTYSLGFTVGSDHPRVGWSERSLPAARDGRPGPDGFSTVEPLARTGVLTPSETARVVATFTAGFKRSHGAFKSGPLATANRGSHYGFIEQGVVLSSLQPGLSTVLVTNDGGVDIRVWAEGDTTDDVAFARQNGVPLVQPGASGPEPGPLVPQWGAGNWSGSADEKLRSLRAGACFIDAGDRRFLVYGWFSTATPSGMARIFLAAGCRDALLLDMNALEHTYAAQYRSEGGQLQVRHLVDGMEVLDIEQQGSQRLTVPTYLSVVGRTDEAASLRRRIQHRRVGSAVLLGVAAGGLVAAVGGGFAYMIARDPYERAGGSVMSLAGGLTALLSVGGSFGLASDTRRLRWSFPGTFDGGIQDEVREHNARLRQGLHLNVSDVRLLDEPLLR